MEPDLKGYKKIRREKKWESGWMECKIEGLYESPEGVLYLWSYPCLAQFDETKCDYNPGTDRRSKCGYSCMTKREYYFIDNERGYYKEPLSRSWYSGIASDWHE